MHRWASREPVRLFIASDANPDALLETAWKSGRKPARGGVSNLLCIAEPLDVLVQELGPVADRVSMILPWGSLLAAVAKPDLDSLRQIASLCQPNASIEILFSYESQRDAREIASLGITDLNQEHIMRLPSVYEQAGLRVLSVETLPQRGLAAYETTWAKRLAFGRPREVWRLRAVGSF